jgi:type VI secretion system protein ImpB
MSESQQHKLDRVRRPRVQITYDVETGGAMEQKELPFVVGGIADLTGDAAEPMKPLKDRSFTPIDRDNFNDVMTKAKPRIAYRVDNKLTDDDSQLNVELNFSEFDDFEPARVARQIPALKELLDMREKLNELLGKMEGNDKLEALLKEVMTNTEAANQVAGDLGVDPSAAPAAKADKPEKPQQPEKPKA